MWYYDPSPEHPNKTEDGKIAPDLALEIPPAVKVAVEGGIPPRAESSGCAAMPGSEYWLP